MSDQKKTPQENEDKELADLLDSALQDFSDNTSTKTDKTSEESKPNESKEEAITQTVLADTRVFGTCRSCIDNILKNCEHYESQVLDTHISDLKGQLLIFHMKVDIPQEWSSEFIQQAAMQFEENFAKMLTGGDPNAQVSPDVVQDKLKQMADAAQQVLSNPTDISDQSVDFASSISQAIAGISQGQENLRAPFNEDDLMKMFGGGTPGQEADILPFMQGMMQGLLSREVLAPSLQDFVEKLPAYLEKNKDTLSKEDAERYENQRKLMEEVLEELNKEKQTDGVEVKKERFTKVLALMQKLQDYGQPPAELVGEVDTPFAFDAAGNPTTLQNPDLTTNPECCVM